MPFVAFPLPPHDPALDAVADVLDPVLTPLGFAAGQLGASERTGQVIYCRGFEGSPDDGCIDLVVDLAAAPDWRITDVRYWGFPAERWHLRFVSDADLATQLDALTRTLLEDLAE